MGNVFDDDPEFRSLVGYFEGLAGKNPTFDTFLNLEDDSPDLDLARFKFEMRDDFVGNLVYRILHGGLISAVLDTVGGAAVFMSVYKQVRDKPREVQVRKLSKNATIDLRVDYLRPGKGREFTATGWILRTGNKVAVARMELRNEQGDLIAVGTGCYSIGS
ncbi:MAG: thioesterase family protein [Chloroflexi bacterium]|nr:thioesterase family protein [Chloroflexota bacterium]